MANFWRIFAISFFIYICKSNDSVSKNEIDTNSALWVLWLFVGSCLIVVLVGCAAFERFKAEFLRLKVLASIDVDFNHTKEDEADAEVSDDDKVEELHYAMDKKEEKEENENNDNMRLSAQQNMEKLLELINETMTTTVQAAKREMNRMKEIIRVHKQNVFDNMWMKDEVDDDMMIAEEDHAVI